MRQGWDNRYQAATVDDLDRRMRRLDGQGKLPESTIANLKALLAPATNSAQISFEVVSLAGLDSLVLLRNTTKDPGSASALQSWSSSSLAALTANPLVTYSDVDPAIIGKTAYYWVQIVPTAKAAADAYLVGPQSVDQSYLGTATPGQVVDFDVSHGAGSGGSVLVSVNVTPGDSNFASLKIYASGYQGNPDPVAVAQRATTDFSFFLLQTGETITLTAVAVSIAGVEAPIGGAPTKALTLTSPATVPVKPMNVTATELSTGVQIGFPSNPETTITQYLIYRGPRGGGFGGAAQIGTVASSGAANYTFLDTAGLTGQFEWYVIAKNAIGNSANSSAVVTVVFATSADLPPNVPTNVTNFATVDSIDNGTTATIRVYGVGGVGSSWTRATGYGATETFPTFSQSGKTYSTDYYVMFDKATATYVVTTSIPNILPDSYVWVGKTHTVAAGGAGGVGGGGGAAGGIGGCVEFGTPAEYPDNTTEYSESPEENWEWIHFRGAGQEVISVHPRTLVAVWKRAEDLKLGDLLDVSDFGETAYLVEHKPLRYRGLKVRRNVVPSHQYRARRYRLHNMKVE